MKLTPKLLVSLRAYDLQGNAEIFCKGPPSLSELICFLFFFFYKGSQLSSYLS